MSTPYRTTEKPGLGRANATWRTSARFLALVSLCTFTLIVSSLSDAWAAFPGTNGKIAFLREFGQIFTMNPDGSDQTRITFSSQNFEPSWSADGTKIVFASQAMGSRDIYTMDPDGSNVTQITTDSLDDSSPTWSPDRTKIAFARNLNSFDNLQIFVINADGTGETQITNTAGAEMNPHWSPDGSKLVFQSNRDGRREIYVMNVDGTGQTRLTNHPGNDEWPDWSPDGSRITFTSWRDGNTEIYVMNADGTGQVRVTNNPAHDEIPSWSPDGTKIAFRSDRDGNFEVYTMDVDGGNQVNLTNHPANDWFPDWQPSPARPVLGLAETVELDEYKLNPGDRIILLTTGREALGDVIISANLPCESTGGAEDRQAGDDIPDVVIYSGVLDTTTDPSTVSLNHLIIDEKNDDTGSVAPLKYCIFADSRNVQDDNIVFLVNDGKERIHLADGVVVSIASSGD